MNCLPVLNRRSVGSLFLIVALCACFSLAGSPALAQFWNGSSSTDWHTGANWDGGAVPTFGNNAAVASNVNSGTVVDISSANADSDGIFVGLEINGSVVNGTVNHSAFTGTYTNGMVIGRGGATGTYNQTGASTVGTGFVNVGSADGAAAIPAGTGHYTLGDTSVLNASSFVIMGELPGSTGTMTLNGSSTVNANLPGNASVVVGRQASIGTLNINDSAMLNAADRIHVGDFEGAKGTINQTGGIVNSAVTWLGVFDAGGQGTEGTYNISGTAVHNTFQMIVGRDGGKGTLDVSDSALIDIRDPLIIGDFNGGNGTVNQSGGTVDVGAWVGVGNGAGTTGAYNLSGGDLKIGTIANDDLKVGDAGVGTFTQSGASTVTMSRDLVVSAQGSSAGSSYTQNGGDVTVGTNGGWMIVGRDDQSNGTYNLNGGSIDARGRLVVGADGGSTGLLNVTDGTITTGDSLVVSRHGTGNLVQSGGTINTQNVDLGGDPGSADVSGGGRYTMLGGSLNAANDLRIGLNANSGAPFAVGMSVAGTSAVVVTGNLEVSIDGNGDFLTQGSAASINIGGNLDANSANVAQLIWGSDAGGVNAIHVGGDVDVTDAQLLLQLTENPTGAVTGLVTFEQATPSDLLLIDNQGVNAITGLLSFNNLVDPLQVLNEGDLLVDNVLGLLNGLQYTITYVGGDGNDLVLQLVPEPTTMVMLIMGAGLFGLVRRRR